MIRLNRLTKITISLMYRMEKISRLVLCTEWRKNHYSSMPWQHQLHTVPITDRRIGTRQIDISGIKSTDVAVYGIKHRGK
jgi:hypothetical protein